VDLVEIPEDSGFARHPWETVRARFFGDLLAPMLDGQPTSLLDAGAGDGWFARQLAAQHRNLSVTCFDPGYGEDLAERLPKVERVSYSTSQPTGPFDVLVLLDVLEHVEDDAALLDSLSQTVRPGGHVLVSVPAWPKLFSRHDVALRHHRRYEPRELAALLNRSGMTVIRAGGLFHSLLAPRWLAVAAERLRSSGRADRSQPAQHELRWRGGELSRRLVEAFLGADVRLSREASDRGVGLPGLSCWALCRRP
jgi:SAM-dependent methyltransferase